MKLNLNLKNFQSISSADFEFETGINIITGSNSSGKTAILRALYAILTNPSHAKRYIKHGESSTTVSLDIPEYNQNIEWTRKESGVKYIINGSENTKCGRNTLFDFTDEMPFVYDEGLGKVLNLQTEHDGLFPFNRSNTDMFKLFEDIFQISDSSAIVGSIKKDEQETHKNIANLKLKSKDIEDKLSYLTDFNSNYHFQDVDDLKKQCHSILNELKNLDAFYKQAQILENEINNIVIPLKQEFDLSIISDFHNIDSIYQETQNLSDFINNVSIQKQEIDLTSIMDLIAMDEALLTCQDLESINDIILESQEIDLSVILEYLDIEYDDANDLVTELREIKNQIDNLTLEKHKIEDEISKIQVCPLCEQELHTNHN